MEKLVIAGMTHSKNGSYVKLKATRTCMRTIKKMLSDEERASFLVDNQVIPQNLSNYSKWKDVWIPFRDGDIICGDRFIHMFFNKKSNMVLLRMLEKHCEWAKVKVRTAAQRTIKQI